MAEISPQSPYSGQEPIPFWRDGRVIGIIAQIIFVILVDGRNNFSGQQCPSKSR